MALFVDAATTRLIMLALNRDHGFDVRVRLVVKYLEILVTIIKQALGMSFYGQTWQRQKIAAELLVRLLEMIGVKMTITASPDEIAYGQAGLLRQHMREQRV